VATSRSISPSKSFTSATPTLGKGFFTQVKEVNASRLEAVNLCSHGEYSIENGDFEGAIADYTEVLRLDEGNVYALVSRAWAKVRRGDALGAIADCNEALAINERSPFGFGVRAEAKCRSGDLHGAIEDCNRALSFDENDGFALGVRGEVQIKQGKHWAAVQDMKGPSTEEAQQCDRGMWQKVQTTTQRCRGLV